MKLLFYFGKLKSNLLTEIIKKNNQNIGRVGLLKSELTKEIGPFHSNPQQKRKEYSCFFVILLKRRRTERGKEILQELSSSSVITDI